MILVVVGAYRPTVGNTVSPGETFTLAKSNESGLRCAFMNESDLKSGARQACPRGRLYKLFQVRDFLLNRQCAKMEKFWTE